MYFRANVTVLESRHLHMTDQKRPAGFTLVRWAYSREVTVVDSLSPSRISERYANAACVLGTNNVDLKKDRRLQLIAINNI